MIPLGLTIFIGSTLAALALGGMLPGFKNIPLTEAQGFAGLLACFTATVAGLALVIAGVWMR